jgi:hypothetical protein
VSSVRNYGTAPVEVEQGCSGELHGVEAKPLRGSVGLEVRHSSVAAAAQGPLRSGAERRGGSRLRAALERNVWRTGVAGEV